MIIPDVDSIELVSPHLDYCQQCKGWGRTASKDFGIACPKCGRMTHPNLGVNMAAGSAVCHSVNQGIAILQAIAILDQQSHASPRAARPPL